MKAFADEYALLEEIDAEWKDKHWGLLQEVKKVDDRIKEKREREFKARQ